MTSQTDRSRYMAGWSCEWRRLLGYHAFDTGISPASVSTPLATGVYTHQALELLLKSQASSKEEVTAVIAPALTAYREYAAGTDLPVDEQVALVEGMTHAYARIVLPWMRENFKVIAIEQEEQTKYPSDEAPLIDWMSRPDFVTEHLQTGAIAIHDFKTSGSWSESRDVGEYADSVQMMMNADAVERRLGKPVSYYYIHILLKGNDYAQSPLIYPYYRPGIPAIQKPDLKAYYKYQDANGGFHNIGRGYTRMPVWQSMPVADWVWDMSAEDCAKQTILIGPYPVVRRKIERFVAGALGNELHWQQRLRGLNWERWEETAFQRELDHKFPRTYQCYTYGTRCSFYALCHQHDGWKDPIGSGLYEERTPHHTTEEV